MNIKKMLITTIVATSISSMGFAADLTIVNNTSKNSTSKINNGLCSNKVLGADGVTRANTTKVIKEFQIRLACMMNLENCKAEVYMTDNCTGDKLTTVTFSVKTGIKSVGPLKDGYTVTYAPFRIQIDETNTQN